MFILYFSLMKFRLCIFGKHTIKWCCICSTPHQEVLVLVILTLITCLSWCLPGFFTVKLFFSFYLICFRPYKYIRIHSPVHCSICYWFLPVCFLVWRLKNYDSFYIISWHSVKKGISFWLIGYILDSWVFIVFHGLLSTGAIYFDPQIVLDLTF